MALLRGRKGELPPPLVASSGADVRPLADGERFAFRSCRARVRVGLPGWDTAPTRGANLIPRSRPHAPSSTQHPDHKSHRPSTGLVSPRPRCSSRRRHVALHTPRDRWRWGSRELPASDRSNAWRGRAHHPLLGLVHQGGVTRSLTVCLETPALSAAVRSTRGLACRPSRHLQASSRRRPALAALPSRTPSRELPDVLHAHRP